jgi:hypothetical protein
MLGVVVRGWKHVKVALDKRQTPHPPSPSESEPCGRRMAVNALSMDLSARLLEVPGKAMLAVPCWWSDMSTSIQLDGGSSGFLTPLVLVEHCNSARNSREPILFCLPDYWAVGFVFFRCIMFGLAPS